MAESVAEEAAIKEEVAHLWQDYLAAVVNADFEAFDAFAVARDSGTAGDPDALQRRQTEITVLTDDLALVQFSGVLRDAGVYYGESVLFQREEGGWALIHAHSSTAPVE